MDIPTHEQLVERIDRFLERHDMAPTRLGREATGEPNLIPSIRAGRSPSLETLNRLGRLMADYDAKLPPEPERATEWPIETSAAPEVAHGPFSETAAVEHRRDPPLTGAQCPALPSPPSTSPTSSETSAPPAPPAASRACSTAGEAEAA